MLKEGLNHPSNIRSMLNFIDRTIRLPYFRGSNFFHDVVHDLGMNLYQQYQDPYQALKNCSFQFQSGCYHGVIMSYFDDTTSVNDFSFSKGGEFCNGLRDRIKVSDFEYLQCLHGIGHIGIAKVRGDLLLALSGCDLMKTNSLKKACYDGVFMEYSKGESQSGHHSHAELGSIVLPCNRLDSRYRRFCYFTFGRNNPQFLKNRADYYGVAKVCNQLEDESTYDLTVGVSSPFFGGAESTEAESDSAKADKDSFFCMIGMARRLLYQTLDDLFKAQKICRGMGELKEACKQAIIYVEVYQISEPEDKPELCKFVPGLAKDLCLKSKLAFYNLIL